MPRSGVSDITSAIDDSYGRTVFSHQRRQIETNRGGPPREGTWNANSTTFGSAIDDNSPTIWRGHGPEPGNSAVDHDTKPLEASLLRKLMKASVAREIDAEKEREARMEPNPPYQASYKHDASVPETSSPPQQFILRKTTLLPARLEKPENTAGETPIRSSSAFKDFAKEVNNTRVGHKRRTHDPSNRDKRDRASKSNRDPLNRVVEDSAPTSDADFQAPWNEQRQEKSGRRANDVEKAATMVIDSALGSADHARESDERRSSEAVADRSSVSPDIFGFLDETPPPYGRSKHAERSMSEFRDAMHDIDTNRRRLSLCSITRKSATRSPSQKTSNAPTSQVSEKSSQTHISTKSLRDAISQIDLNSQGSNWAGKANGDEDWSRDNAVDKATGTRRSLNPTVQTLSERSTTSLNDVQEQLDGRFWRSTSPGKKTIPSSQEQSPMEEENVSTCHRDARQTRFAGLGWISPHPLSVLSSGHPSHPQTFVEVHDEGTGALRQLTHEEWLEMQKDRVAESQVSGYRHDVQRRLAPRNQADSMNSQATRSEHRNLRYYDSKSGTEKSHTIGSNSTSRVSARPRSAGDKPGLVRQDTASETGSPERADSARRSTHYHVHYHLPSRESSRRSQDSREPSKTDSDRITDSSRSQASHGSKSSSPTQGSGRDVRVQSIEGSKTRKSNQYIPPQYRVGSVTSTTWQDLEDMERGNGKFQPKSRKQTGTRRD